MSHKLSIDVHELADAKHVSIVFEAEEVIEEDEEIYLDSYGHPRA